VGTILVRDDRSIVTTQPDLSEVMAGRTAPNTERAAPGVVSIGVIVWNEEDGIRAALESIFAQSLFAELGRRRARCEIVCVVNGCTDDTPRIAAEVFEEQSREHPLRDVFTCRIVELRERGKLRAWNLFVHEISARDASLLFLMDGDIVLHGAGTLWNMCAALLEDLAASVSTDQLHKDLAFKPRKSLRDRISLATSDMSQTGVAQLSGQLYCIRAPVARNIYLPSGLPACEDGFIKALVCTDFLTQEVDPRRITRARDAAHVFEAYTSVASVFRNQKRQMIGQTALHVLDLHLRALPREARERLAETLMEMERKDPLWLKRLISEHVRGVRGFWELFPGVIGFRFKRLMKIEGAKKITYLPAALVGFFVTVVSSVMAYRFLRQGHLDFWPEKKSTRSTLRSR
jgi:glycosyltransferase involved in cell wall biosynthesis